LPSLVLPSPCENENCEVWNLSHSNSSTRSALLTLSPQSAHPVQKKKSLPRKSPSSRPIPSDRPTWSAIYGNAESPSLLHDSFFSKPGTNWKQRPIMPWLSPTMPADSNCLTETATYAYHHMDPPSSVINARTSLSSRMP